MKILDLNPNIKPLLIALTLLVTVFILKGCSPEKRMQKAEQMVRTNPESFNTIGKQWGLLNPCSNDTLIQLLEDTTTHHDTTILKGKDSLHLDTIYLTTERLITKVKIQTVVDRQKQKLDADSISILNNRLAELQGQILEKDKRIKTGEQKITGWIWWFILAICGGILSNGAWVVAKFKGII